MHQQIVRCGNNACTIRRLLLTALQLNSVPYGAGSFDSCRLSKVQHVIIVCVCVRVRVCVYVLNLNNNSISDTFHRHHEIQHQQHSPLLYGSITKRKNQHHTITDLEASSQAHKSTWLMLLLVIGTETATLLLDTPDIIFSSDTCNSSFL